MHSDGMHSDAMEPFGRALTAYLDGDTSAELIVRRDDGKAVPLPVAVFFREPTEFNPIERDALELCAGRVLDVGAGTGLHSLALIERGLEVTPIDINPKTVEVMKRRGLTNAECADISGFRAGPFDTLLMMGHGIGMVGSIAGLDRFLARLSDLTTAGGQVLLDSLDVRKTDDPSDLAYHEANRKAGRYMGEIRMQSEFRGVAGKYFGWLQVDAETLGQHAASAGWHRELVRQEERGDYVARLTRG